ncbi:uncharacterized protein LOC123558022 [Mercenaria mercenaria]|uniref:uncharacterized protein LOC123558022 n=1 Tax=Mercenaria mercenaria TaxID=6596 RepID=UPI00234F107F|nr:uncharacterized protein LOC123558022 [Mercenaria mercenaria]
MEEILQEVKAFDTKTLREKLAENGVIVGPIAPTTISLFQKRLANELFRRRGGVREEQTSNEAGPLKENESTSVVKKDNVVSDVYYAVCLPENVEQDSNEADQLVFADKDLALKTAKKYTGSRFKVFKSEQDAKVFSRLTAESAFQSPRRPSKEDTPVKEAAPPSESSPFKGPKLQDLTKLRKVIESGDVDTFREQVWDNPRFLVSSGDTPVMYQEGSRYTAMHIAAIKNKPEICQTILDVLENPEFVNKLYSQSKHSEETQNIRINFLVDLYLNMPDKGSCESPLHMACKYGHERVVEVLASHPRTDKQLKNKWGDTPKDQICTRCSDASQSVKKKIEDLLQGQCYVPLMRSDDNTVTPVIGQPWSPDVSKSTDMPRITSSPRDPSMSVRACAGPMSPSEAGLFHKRWTTPPLVSQSPDQVRAYFNTKRSDCEKGMERIGRQLAHDLQVPWSEYWEFLDQFIDLSTSAGLGMLEYYLKKRVWLTFVKDFKEKFGLNEQVLDFSGLTTPVTNRLRSITGEDADKSFDSVFYGNKDVCKNSTDNKNKDIGNETRGTKEGRQCSERNEDQGGNNILSPVSALSNSFAQLKLMDESWSDKATVDSSQKSVTDDENCNRLDAIASVSAKDNAVEGSDSDKPKIDEKSNETVNDNKDMLSDKVKEPVDTDKTVESLREAGKDNRDQDVVETEKVDDVVRKRLLSVGSESTASYETAVEDVSDGNKTYCSQLSEPGTFHVILNIKDCAIITTLIDYIKTSDLHQQEMSDHSAVDFVVQFKDVNGDGEIKVNVVSIPKIESANKLLLLEDIDVESCDGDISKVQEGEIVELGTSSGQEGNQSIMAYLTRAVTLPKTKYIYGPQPTREDLNVSRALSCVTISPELHPNVFHWKINLSRFLRDTNYRWQSPAKLQSKLRQGSPQPSPLGKTSPVIPYRSPLSGQPANVITSDIRTKLFPSIIE